MHSTLFLVDFDGTICNVDLGNLIIKHAAGLSWSQHVTRMGALDDPSLPRHNFSPWEHVKLDETDYRKLVLELASPREGFLRWLEKANSLNHAVYVVSAGLESYVRTCLEEWCPHLISKDHIIAVPCKKSGPFQYARPDIDQILARPELTGYAKDRVANRLRGLHPKSHIVAIGDGRSDVLMAAVADRVYARRYLADHLKEAGQPFTPFESFYEIEPLRNDP